MGDHAHRVAQIPEDERSGPMGHGGRLGEIVGEARLEDGMRERDQGGLGVDCRIQARDRAR
jgi:hypothetical protein